MGQIKKIWEHRKDLRSVLYSIFLNFHYLPFKQAIKLPILLYKPHLLDLKGKIILDGNVKYGMVRLGFPILSLFPNTGFVFENHGGTIVFKGRCLIGNNSAISIGEKGYLEIGDHFSATSFRLASYDKIVFGERCRLGWDCLIIDTDFHKLCKLAGGFSHGHAPIVIGSNNWFGNGCKIMKRTKTPNYCIVSAGTILTGPVDVPEYCIVGSRNEVVIKATGIWRNIDDDKIEY